MSERVAITMMYEIHDREAFEAAFRAAYLQNGGLEEDADDAPGGSDAYRLYELIPAIPGTEDLGYVS